jgi:hypothetical protein
VGVVMMSDWYLVVGPIVAAVYFAANPAQFSALIVWFERLF